MTAKSATCGGSHSSSTKNHLILWSFCGKVQVESQNFNKPFGEHLNAEQDKDWIVEHDILKVLWEKAIDKTEIYCYIFCIRQFLIGKSNF